MKRRAGFTLIELAVTLAVLAVVLAVAAPSFSRWFAAQHLAGATDAVAEALRHARKQALTTQQAVWLGATPGGQWTLRADARANAACDAAWLCVDGADYRGVQLETGSTPIRFSPLKGLPYQAGGAPGSAVFTLSQSGCTPGRVTLLATGFVTAEHGRCG
ncbi:pilus assembly FimT family protein [Crenobacter caeni]|uniref:Type II secretion system protein H n=1 Tax=Crenobacter caeni TaxID=2705474 RepID=A0A6B2KSW0_9NEIS|nr:GspH/FimT family pseudopilin [Crenobacter caeni]NDV13228.1 prepilin-type N-terminal cleavage/methylation domain-containing protein [Crenobacter caeni]